MKAPGSPACPLCDGLSAFAYIAHDRGYGVTAFRAHIYRCRACHSLFQYPIPDRATIAGFYPQGYWRESGQPGRMTRLQNRYIDWMLRWDPMRQFRRLDLPPGSRVLDVGCSRGDWLAAIRTKGHQVRGLEADAGAAAFAREKYGLDIEETDGDGWQPAEACCDAILFFHLLEHLRQPARFLETCQRALVPGGKLLLRVPNPQSWQHCLFPRRWKGLEMPRHITLPTRKALISLLQRYGFKLVWAGSWSWRDGPTALASTLLPKAEPTYQQIKGRARPLLTLCYLALTWLVTPWEMLAAACGRGAMLTLIAVKNQP